MTTRAQRRERILGLTIPSLLLAACRCCRQSRPSWCRRALPPRRAPRSDGPGIDTEAQLRRAWADPRRTRIDLAGDIVLRDCLIGDPIRESPYPMLVDGHGHSIRQACFEKRLLRQDGTGYLELERPHLSRGGTDGPGAAVTTRGEITAGRLHRHQNLAEEPGGGDLLDAPGHRAPLDDQREPRQRRRRRRLRPPRRRRGLRLGAQQQPRRRIGRGVGSTGDILVVRSRVDGNTTDGDGGALYADEDGDVTVIDSTIDGSDADGPGGAIFTLDGDVAVLDSTLIGNRADDRGGAISGEADVLVVNSTIARNLAVAHAGGGIWARGDLCSSTRRSPTTTPRARVAACSPPAD